MLFSTHARHVRAWRSGAAQNGLAARCGWINRLKESMDEQRICKQDPHATRRRTHVLYPWL